MIDKLTQHAMDKGVNIIDTRMPSRKIKGLYSDGLILIAKGLSEAEYTCVLAEEIGHHETSHGNILDQNKVINAKQEYKAREWANTYLISFDRLIEAYHARVSGPHDLADFLGVTVDYLIEAVSRYNSKYGSHVKVGDYIIYFDPLGIMKIL